MRNKEVYLVVFLVLISVSLVSAGFFDNIKATITGKATSKPTNISVTVAGSSQLVIKVVNSTIGTVDPSEANVRNITFYVNVSDADGVNDVNDTSISVNFSRANEANRTNSTCTLVGDLDNTTANFSCTVGMWYWDANGTWTINVTGKDLGNQSIMYNESTLFQFNQLKALVISPEELTWTSLSPGAINQTAGNDPTLINNTGNYNGTINVTTIDLAGETVSSQAIPAANFTIDIDTGATPPDECNGTAMVNNTATIVINSITNRGNNTAGNGQEQLYYCLRQVPIISSQTYSTDALGSWTIGI